MNIRRPREHVPAEDPDTPGVCAYCRLPTAVPNDRHITPADLPTTPTEQTDAEHRRIGEGTQ